MKKIINRIIAVICIVVLFIGCGEGFRYILVDDTSSYTRLTMHQLYNSAKNIDIMFIGSSHCYRALIPKITDEIFGAYTFNAGTSSQQMDGSYAMIREGVSNYDVNHIYLEIYYGVCSDDAYKNRTNLTQTYIISDYMRLSLRKVQYLINASSKEYWSNSFILARRNWENFFDFEYVKNLIQKKQTDSYKSYKWIRTQNQAEYYVDRGFVANDNVVAEGIYWNSTAYGEITAPKTITSESDWTISLQSIMEYCKKKNVELTLFVTPEPEWTLVGKGNYQSYVDMIRTIADENALGFYDFNLCKSEYFDSNDKNLFKDEHHLNTNGAEAFSTLFSKFFTGQISEEDLFYDTYDEKLVNESPMVYGVAGPKENKQEGVNNAYIISNRSEGIEYRIIATSEDGHQRLIQDFDENKIFSLPIDEHGTLDINWRISENTNKTQTIEFTY